MMSENLFIELEKELQSLIGTTKPSYRKKLARKLGMAIRLDQQKRIRQQKNVDGSSYAPRKKKLRRTQLGIRFLWNGEARTLSNWRSSKTSSGRMITGFDVDKGAVRSFNRDDIERYLEINRSEKRQTVKRDYPMFRKLRTAQFLYAKAYPNAAVVEFKGKAADIARQHQYGLMGTVSALTKVRYPQRELLGVSPSEKVKLLNLVYHDLMDELRK
ncbi:phage virion morphogenesis protein [Pectobacterium colocasium]|uniref:phage virion morphogenesis protein n=2 Tax=Pectobacteriaceae TaxID=1903410 RepID=UPI003305E76E